MIPEGNRIYLGDCLDLMRSWPDTFVQTCVTSPPYWGLRDYKTKGQMGMESSLIKYVEQMVAVFRDVRRILQDDGTLWLNLGDSYASAWPCSRRNIIGDGSPTAEQRRKRIPRGAGRWGGGNNGGPGLKEKDLIGMPWRIALALQADGWFLRSDIIWSKPNPMPESVTDRPTKSHEYLFLLTKSVRYYYDAAAIYERGSENKPWSQSSNGGKKALLVRNDGNLGGLGKPASRKVPSGWDTGPGSHDKKMGRYKCLPEGQVNIRAVRNKQRGHGRRHDGFNARWDVMEKAEQCSGMRNKRSVWTVATSPFAEAHFATFPPKLIEPCILAGSKSGDIVFDPFMGAGTTALVAAQYGRRYLGTELNPEYLAIAEARIANETAQMKMAI